MPSNAPALSATDSLTRRHPVPPGAFQFEPSGRRVRALVRGITLVDSYRPVLVWEPDRPVPVYVFPRADVRTELLVPGTERVQPRHQQVKQSYDVVVEGDVLHALVYEYDVEGLEGYLGVDWFGRELPGVEHWYEEDEEIFKHPRDPYKRVDALPSSRHVQVLLDGVTLADTHHPVLLFETRVTTRYYIPADDVDFSHLTETDLSTICPYKGNARYWSAEVDGKSYPDIVWSYPEPLPAVAAIKGCLAFYNELVDTVLDGEPIARPERPFRAPQGN